MRIYAQSRIEDESEGFDEDKIFKLDNGQVWQQSVYKYKYRYKYRPKVTIWTDGGAYFIEIEGIEEKVRVQRLE